MHLTLSEVSQTGKGKYHPISFTGEAVENDTDHSIEKWLMVTRGNGRDKLGLGIAHIHYYVKNR